MDRDEGQSTSPPEGTSFSAAPDLAFERFVRMVRAQLRVPVALVSFVTSGEQVLPGAAGLPAAYQLSRPLGTVADARAGV